MYNIFAKYYNALMRDSGHPDILNFCRRFFPIRQGCDNILLDLACGTGILSASFAADGYDVISLDASEGMLSLARQRVDSLGLSGKILFLHQRMEALDLFGTIDYALCSFDSLNHLDSAEAFIKTLSRVSLFMNPGGIFIFDVNTIYKHRITLNNNAFVFDEDSFYCVWQNHLINEDSSVEIQLDFFERCGKLYQRETECFSERAYELSLIDKWLAETGFSIISMHNGYTDKPVTNSTERAVYVVCKSK